MTRVKLGGRELVIDDSELAAYLKLGYAVIDGKGKMCIRDRVYAKADSARLIEEADKQFQRLMWEFEGGELAIDASTDAFKTKGGIPELPTGKERLYRINKLDSATVSDELMKMCIRDSG